MRLLLGAFEEAAQRMQLSKKYAHSVHVERLPAQLRHPRVGLACFTPHAPRVTPDGQQIIPQGP